ncbi:hypothetical protein [Pontibacter burrus]|uniref:Uncharacterized protein n=1 Tax=Pontibacter burrus TaxID=2704466 RepID=A0A6B3LJC2_9BACT|nr:hypothetical protein [Pontibacter burrus]NEM96073.1 hypothetical protein [Pontibacter burrus]
MKPTDKKQNNAEEQKKPAADSASQGHATKPQGTGHTTANKEPTLRSVTTDSSRVHKHRGDDLPSGGNIR